MGKGSGSCQTRSSLQINQAGQSADGYHPQITEVKKLDFTSKSHWNAAQLVKAAQMGYEFDYVINQPAILSNLGAPNSVWVQYIKSTIQNPQTYPSNAPTDLQPQQNALAEKIHEMQKSLLNAKEISDDLKKHPNKVLFEDNPNLQADFKTYNQQLSKMGSYLRSSSVFRFAGMHQDHCCLLYDANGNFKNVSLYELKPLPANHFVGSKIYIFEYPLFAAASYYTQMIQLEKRLALAKNYKSVSFQQELQEELDDIKTKLQKHYDKPSQISKSLHKANLALDDFESKLGKLYMDYLKLKTQAGI